MMKRFKFLLIVALCSILGSATAVAQDKIKIGNATYMVTSGVATLSDYKKAQGDVVIPSEITDKQGNVCPVTAIGPEAFKKSKIESVIIPSSVTTLDQSCFESAKKLSSVQFTDHKIAEIPEKAFANCQALEAFSFEGVKKIGYKAFANTGLKEIVIPENVIEINGSFMECSKLSSITFEDSDSSILICEHPFHSAQVKKIYLGRNYNYVVSEEHKDWENGGHPFNNNIYLETFDIGPKVTEIKDDSFLRNCTNLTSLSSGWEIGFDLLSKKYPNTGLRYLKIPRNGEIELPHYISSIGELSTSDLKESRFQFNRFYIKCFAEDAIEEFEKTGDVDTLYAGYIKIDSRYSLGELKGKAFNLMLDAMEKMPVNERISKKCANEWILINWLKSFKDADYALALRIAKLIRETYNDNAYAVAWVPILLTRMGYYNRSYYEEAAREYPKAIEIVTNRGQYAIPDELSSAGLELRRVLPEEKTKDILVTQYDVQAKYKKSKNNSSSDSSIGVEDIFDAVGAVYKSQKRNKHDKEEEDLAKALKKNKKTIKKLMRDK